MNAVKFLNVEDTRMQKVRCGGRWMPIQRIGNLRPTWASQYATEILGNAPEISAHATAELERSSNAIVLAAAGTALPNLAVHGSGGRPVDPKIFELASELAARARELAPGDADVQGPMPLIKYFSAFAAEQPAAEAARSNPSWRNRSSRKSDPEDAASDSRRYPAHRPGALHRDHRPRWNDSGPSIGEWASATGPSCPGRRADLALQADPIERHAGGGGDYDYCFVPSKLAF